MSEVLNINFNNRSINSPIKENEFLLSDYEKIKKIEGLFAEIMQTLGLNLNDDSLCNTPKRVAKMFVKEMFSGLNPDNKPYISLFENKYGYKNMLIEKDITLYSNCEHHFVLIIGKAHVAYIPGKQVIGLSKINRLVQYYAKRPQVQERLTIQIADALKEILQHDDVAVVIEADHLCVASRGIKDTNSKTHTASYSGRFKEEAIKQEFLAHIYHKK
ncbi:MAG: GTP cyclohydrolase I FolE [Ferruginibacter sp.]|nr:GTP cyclohydrolase I FolE [Bacteroidota bacterium]MBX2918161.1 GTP cyclohydrolase I FolE [Ferruginibacter sp.]MCB0708617.1 GTP cyclohydrolase I FolE [Chitinophagaceae bacterium]